MKLMGDANWWLPGWLDRLLPTIGVHDEAGSPILDASRRRRPSPRADAHA